MISKDSNTIVCIPTLNEADTILEVIQSIRNYTTDFQILVIDDDSSDDTAKIVEDIRDPLLHVLKRHGKLGFASAYIDGFNFALQNGFEWIVQMDADMSHHPKFLPDFVKAQNTSDFVVGSRYVSGGKVTNWGFHRKILSRFGNSYAKLFLSRNLNDYTGGYNMWNRRVLEKINLESIQSRGYSFLMELKYLALKAGCKSFEIPIVFEDRKVGQSKMSYGIMFEAMYKVPKIRFAKRNSK